MKRAPSSPGQRSQSTCRPSSVGIVGGVLPPGGLSPPWSSRNVPVHCTDHGSSSDSTRFSAPRNHGQCATLRACVERVAREHRRSRLPPRSTHLTPSRLSVGRWHDALAPHLRAFHVKHRAYAASIPGPDRRVSRSADVRHGRSYASAGRSAARLIRGGNGDGSDRAGVACPDRSRAWGGVFPGRTPPGSRSDARPDSCLGSTVSRETPLQGRALPVHCACFAALAFRGVSRSGNGTDRRNAAGSPTRVLTTHATVSVAPGDASRSSDRAASGMHLSPRRLHPRTTPGSHALPEVGAPSARCFT